MHEPGRIGKESRQARHTFLTRPGQHQGLCSTWISSGAKLRPHAAAASPAVTDVSWLFDRLAELAIADRVEVVVGLDIAQHVAEPGSIDVAELIVRAARLASTTMLLLPIHPNETALALERAQVVDLETTDRGSLGAMVAEMLAAQRRHCGAVVRVESGRLSLEPYGRLPDRERRGIDSDDSGTGCWIFVREDSTAHLDLDELGPPALRISIGSLDPNANVTIRDASGFVSLLDAFVTLREFAFDSVVSSVNDHNAQAGSVTKSP